MKSTSPKLAYLLPMVVAVALIGIGIFSFVVDGAATNGTPLLRHTLLFCLPFTLLGIALMVSAWLRLVSPGYLAATGMLAACSIRFFSDVADQFLGGPTRLEMPVFIAIGAVTMIVAALSLVAGRRLVNAKSEVDV